MSTVAELEAKVIAGDTSVKPADIEKARAAENFDRLKKLSDEREARHAERQKHADAVAALREEYDQFMAADLTPLQEEYTEAVAFVAYFWKQVAEREAEQREFTARASALGLRRRASHGANNTAPFRDDAERWQANQVSAEKMLGHLFEEAMRGYPTAFGKPITHALHTPQRREQIRSLVGVSDKRDIGQKHLADLIEEQYPDVPDEDTEED